MTTLAPALLVCLSGFASALVATSDSPDLPSKGQGDAWLWSTGDFMPERGWTDQQIPGIGTSQSGDDALPDAPTMPPRA